MRICWPFIFKGPLFVNLRTTADGETGCACRLAMGIFGLTVSLLFIVGCTWQRHGTSLSATTAQDIGVLDESDIIVIAREAVAAHETWADKAIYEARREGKGWLVTVWRIEGHDQSGKPQFVPGGHRIVQIDEKGRVTAYLVGR